jgi:hypothetical protein
MTTGFRNSSGVDFDNVFDPYVQGTKPGAAGYRTSDGVDLNQRFAPLVYGAAAAVTGFRLSSGADVNTLWAAKGTASYALPIDGTLYSQGVNIPSVSSGNATLTFAISGSGWLVTGSGAGGTLTPAAGTRAPGALPSGASTVQYTPTVTSGSGGTVTNGAAAVMAVSGNPSIAVTHAGTGTGSGNNVTRSVLIVFRNSGGAVISSTTIYFDVYYEGSA